MMYFEHEVLSFGTGTKKEHAAMRTALKEWGEAGYEVVSVVPVTIGGSVVNIFLKRQVVSDDGETNVAA